LPVGAILTFDIAQATGIMMKILSIGYLDSS